PVFFSPRSTYALSMNELFSSAEYLQQSGPLHPLLFAVIFPPSVQLAYTISLVCLCIVPKLFQDPFLTSRFHIECAELARTLFPLVYGQYPVKKSCFQLVLNPCQDSF